MFSGKVNVIGFSILLSIVSVAITTSRKYYLTKVGLHSITLIDAILTGAIVCIMVIFHASPGQISKEFKMLSKKDWLICLVTSVAIAIGLFISRSLLIHNDLTYLEIIDGGLDLIVTALVSYLFYNEEMSFRKIGGMVLVFIGLAILH